jgi:hypothetical protein
LAVNCCRVPFGMMLLSGPTAIDRKLGPESELDFE